MRFLITLLMGLLVLPQATEARGGGGGGGHGGGGHGGGTVGFFSAGTFSVPPASVSARPGFSRIPGVRPFAKQQFRFTDGRVPFHDVNRFSNRFDGRVGNRFAGQRFDGGTGWGGWGIGGWSEGGSYSQVPAPAPPPADPQVIVLAQNNPAQRVAVIEPGDYSYAGCHPIPNGYRCGQ